ncbi:reverse transcriptase domain-containing protein [Tanacetum coccineum]
MVERSGGRGVTMVEERWGGGGVTVEMERYGGGLTVGIYQWRGLRGHMSLTSRGLTSWDPFPPQEKKNIIVAVDYVSKCVEAEALPTNDAHVVVKFLKKIFSRFGVLKALISDPGTHFCNSLLGKTLKKYGVTHRLATPYHPQTSGQTENTNRVIKRILEKRLKKLEKNGGEDIIR